MKLEHLSDQDIQRLAFDLPECEQEILAHINVCTICKNRVDAYQEIFKLISNQDKPVFDFNLSDLVLKQIQTSQKESHVFNYIFLGLFVVCFVSLIGLILYSLNHIMFNLWNSISGMFNYFMLGIVILVFFTICFDMLRVYNKKMDRINFL